jgi:hypothetical protein
LPFGAHPRNVQRIKKRKSPDGVIGASQVLVLGQSRYACVSTLCDNPMTMFAIIKGTM